MQDEIRDQIDENVNIYDMVWETKIKKNDNKINFMEHIHSLNYSNFLNLDLLYLPRNK